MSAATSRAERPIDEMEMLRQFRDALFARDIIAPADLLPDGKLHRCDAAGRNGKGDASYLLHVDGVAAGGYQNWRDGIGWEDWRADVGTRELTPEEREDLRRKAAAARYQRGAEEARRRAEAANKAAQIWFAAKPCEEHPYLAQKEVQAHGVRLSRGDLVVPLRDVAGALHSLQFIKPDGGKKYLTGGRVSGCYHAVGQAGDIILVGEGYATCATVHEVTQHAVATAFDAGNLKPVAEALRAKYPKAQIVVIADDDHLTVGNPGISKAREAAAAVSGVVAAPTFGLDRQAGDTDFNDMMRTAGADAVRGCIEASLQAAPHEERAEPDSKWTDPDLSVLRLNRRPPPALPIEVFGPAWASWIEATAAAAACPADYVAGALLSSVSALIGNARWAQATPGWAEPPHLWICNVGESGTGKSPGTDCLMRNVLPKIEAKMAADFPDQLREWRAASEVQAAKQETWKAEVRSAAKAGKSPPLAPLALQISEPQQPRLRQNDVTIEKIAELLGTAAPKGLLVVRDELAGWITGMNAYNDAGRSFWVEAYGGRPYRVERKKNPEPIEVPRLVVAVCGGTQPDKLAMMMREADDGLLARMLWAWPNPIPFRLGEAPTQVPWAIASLDRLRELDLHREGETPEPLMVPLAKDARPLLETFGGEMQERQTSAGGLLCSAYGKARGQALRLSLVLEFMWWCGEDGVAPPPAEITARAFAAAAHLLDSYFMPMAERTYGDAAIPLADRGAATLARWIKSEHPAEVYVRHLQRQVRLPGLATADAIHAAAAVLVDADWLMPPRPVAEFGQKRREASAINPRLWEVLRSPDGPRCSTRSPGTLTLWTQ